MNKSKIKSMKLYNNVGRIFNELREIGKDKSKLLNVEDLIKFDQLHYCGTEAVDFAIKNTQVNISYDINTSDLIPASHKRGGFEFSIIYFWKKKKKNKEKIKPKDTICPKYL